MLPQEIIKQVRRIQFQTGRKVADVLAGEYVSVFKGQGMEFEEVRPYVPGDDVRAIDWNVTARVGAPFIKRYQEERELTVVLLVDVSSSLEFGSGRRSKREAAAELSALLALSASHNNDKVGLLLFHSETEAYIPPRKGQRHALRVVREVLAHEDQPRRAGASATSASAAGASAASASAASASAASASAAGASAAGASGAGVGTSPRGFRGWPRALRAAWARFVQRRADPDAAGRRATRLRHGLEFCRRVLPRRAVLFLISDFIDEGYLQALRAAGRRHDLVAVQIADAREEDLSGAGLLSLEDAETGAVRLVDTSTAGFRAALDEAAERRQRTLRAELRGAGVDLLRIDAGKPVVDPLLQFFRMRQRRKRR